MTDHADGFEHDEVLIRRGSRSELPIVVAVHSTAAGPAVGGCRLWTYPDWRAGLADALDLSAAMTVKCAVAGLPRGGGKTVLPLPPGLRLDPDRRRALFLDVGDAVEELDGRYFIGEDVGTAGPDLLAMAERTGRVMGLPVEHGGVGEPAAPTAAGVVAAIGATCDVVFGTADPAGLRFAVHGLGQVGGRVARWLVERGAVVTGADVDPTRRVPGVATTDPYSLLDLDTDVLVPASLGHLLTRDVVSRLRCRAVVGPANNQLADPSVGELLVERGITWAPDVVVNGGGAIYVVLRETAGAGHEEAMARVGAIGDTVREVLGDAARTGTTPSAAVSELVRRRTA
ncbi:Glu/Leu/Phe/Val dehydrogenase dimerization domain-containing protein [Pseudonocardia humida]|uniref:Glu/Leu/Phe/Val dehydrogenase family protein n=1 Tax=Pseudonocardia humida TaxID=2800819 RepID=A0ABT1A5Q7_9PSEU|nr:Glu/Leu/Phe/Val dehydrogenase dimerization domain-containing protein [Pseudonocardia humida]MCO1658344.1 Glu/Leu/Phe/Val dehydrogenase family protein [Pseudonocardia humida]